MCFLENTFNIHQSSLHIQSFLVAYKLRQRYATIMYSNENDMSSSISNSILRSMNAEYSQKYDDAYRNTYKYLESSLAITSDIINTFIINKKTRSVLIKIK